VEEHFYLLLPILLIVFRKLRILPWLVVLAVVGPPIIRMLSGTPAEGGPFPFYKTHYRADGLAIGVLCSYLAVYRPGLLARMVWPARVAFVPLLLAFLSIAFWSNSAFFAGAYTVATWTSAAALVAIAGRRAIPLGDTRIVRTIALCSYSLYLTHSLALLACLRMLTRFPRMPMAVYRLSECVVVFVVGYLFYLAIERTAIRLRDRLVPR